MNESDLLSVARDAAHDLIAALQRAYHLGRRDGLLARMNALPAPTPTIAQVLDAAHRVAGRPVAPSRRDDKSMIALRWAVTIVLREDLGLSSTQVARAVGYRDHTTVLLICRHRDRHPDSVVYATAIRTQLAQWMAA